MIIKRILLVVVVIAVLIGGYRWVSAQRVSLEALEGKKVTARRGDLEMPITANGYIQPASVTRMKSQASGEVIETPFDVGMMVRRNDLLVRLNETDEQRNVDRAKADLERNRANYKHALTALEERTNVGVPLAKAKLKQMQARKNRTQFQCAQYQRLYDEKAGTPYERDLACAENDEAAALLEAAVVEVTQAEIAIQVAEHEVTVASENLKGAQKAYEDALERLRETKVLSPIDGMVLSRTVQIGEVVQSGRTSLTGGTVLVELADVTDIYAVVNVDEADIGLVRELAPPEARPGPTATQPVKLPENAIDKSQLVEVKVEAFPDRPFPFTGVIERIAPQSEISQAIATFKVWIRITSKNRGDLLGVLNTRAEANFTAKSVINAILVSYDAFQKDPNGEGFGVYVPLKKPGQTKETPQFKRCKFGADNGIDVEVIEGLREGDEVYVQLPQKTHKEEKAEQAEKDAN